MATLVDVPLFTGDQLYNYTTDNIPLAIIQDDLVALNTELIATTAEVTQARTGLTQTYASLDARLDDMELGSGGPQKQIAYNEFRARAADLAARYASGFINPVSEVVRLLDSWTPVASSLPLRLPISGQDGFSGFGQALLRDDAYAKGANRLNLGTGMTPVYNSGSGAYTFSKYRPVDLLVNGFSIRLFGEKGGASPATAGTDLPSEVYWNLPAAPSSGSRVDLLWIEVWLERVSRATPTFYPYGAVGSQSSAFTDADHPELYGNVGFQQSNNGDYFQLRHRLRVTSGVDPDVHPFGMSSGLVVLAQGGNSNPLASAAPYSAFTSAVQTLGDPGLWVAGDGSSGAKSALATLDGYVYAVPFALVTRRNTGQWTLSNQNGSKTSPGDGSWNTLDSGRPDGYYHDKVEPADVVLLASSILPAQADFSKVLETSFDKLLRGDLKTVTGWLSYDSGNKDDSKDTFQEAVVGPTLVETTAISGSAIAKTNTITNPSDSSVALPDDFRRIWGPDDEDQITGLTIDLGGSTVSPSNLVSLSGSTVTIKAGGQSVGSPNNVISEAPILWWAGSKKRVAFTATWTNLGTGTISATLNTGDSAYLSNGVIVGICKIRFRSSSSIRRPNITAVGQTYIDPGLASNSVKAFSKLGAYRLLGPAGVAVNGTGIYIVDSVAHMVYQLNPTTYALLNSFGVYVTSGADNTHLNTPSAIALDASGNVYVADSGNHRVVKLTSVLAYSGQFGVTGTSGTDTTHLNTPRGIALDSTGNLYISDNLNYRIVKTSSAFSYLAQFGVTGVNLSDNTHCFSPLHACVGDDGRLYVADTLRVIVLDPNTLALIAELKNGYALPTVTGGTNYGPWQISPLPVLQVQDDSAGNHYVLQQPNIAGTLNGHLARMITKYDANWNYVIRYGCKWDISSVYGGVNSGTINGLINPQAFVIDEANGILQVFEYNPLPADNLVPGRENRILNINLTTFTMTGLFRRDEFDTHPASVIGPFQGNRPNTNYYPPAFGLQFPTLSVTDANLDTTNGYIYVLFSGGVNPDGSTTSWIRVEKWSRPSVDPATWVFVASFGALGIITSLFTGANTWVPWTNSSHNSTRMFNPTALANAMAMNLDGSALYIADNHSVIKLDTSSTNLLYVGRFGVAGVSGSDTAHVSFTPRGHIVCTAASAADTNGRLYLTDLGNQRIVIVKPNLITTDGSPGAYSATLTHPYFTAKFIGNGISYAKDLLFVRTDEPSVNFGEMAFDISGSKRDAPTYVDPSATSGATTSFSVPYLLRSLPSTVPNALIFGITELSGKVYFTDFNTNQLVALQSPDYYLLGECGNAGISGNDKASWNHPTGIAAAGDLLYICDFSNGRFLVSQKHLAFIEKGCGRVEFLLPPEQGATWYGYTRYTAYQGVYRKGKPTVANTGSIEDYGYPWLTGRSMIQAPNKLIISTLGKGSVQMLTDPGILDYSNSLGRLPIPYGGKDSADVKPVEFSLVGNISRPRPQHTPPVLSVIGLGGSLDGADSSHFSPDMLLSFAGRTLGATGTRGGYQAFEQVPGLIKTPVATNVTAVATFSCGAAPSYRYLVMPFLVSVEGEVLLALRVEGLSAGSSDDPNAVLNETSNQNPANIIELFRPAGRPMIRNLDKQGYVRVTV